MRKLEETPFVRYRFRLSVLLLALALLTPMAVTAQEASPVGAATAMFGYRVVAEYPHDRRAFTQGLAYVDGVLYEGTGLFGESTLRRVDLETGEVLQAVGLSKEYFGEGIAVLGDRIYQLTWKNGLCVVFDRDTFEFQEVLTYQTEGWGLTTDGERLIMSDGTNRLFIRDPETFAELDTIDVYDGVRAIWNLNELEIVDGEIWANVWQTDRIARIDPETGQVTGWIDLTGLLAESDRGSQRVDVLNGIAHDPETDRLFVTGKLWPKLFEIEVVPR
jgi:glutaminyl-peptide cyclotransferase